MTEAQRVNEQAIIGAENDYKKIDNTLEKVKNKIANLEFPHSSQFYLTSAIFVTGFVTGTKVPRPLRKVASFLGGATVGYLGVKILKDIFDESKTNETVVEAVHAAPEDSVITTEVHEVPVKKTELNNVKVIN